MIPNNNRLNEQDGSEKLHGTHDDSAKMNANPENEGHTKEWEERARVVLDAKKDVETEADPNQSPETSEKENGANLNENNSNY